MNSLDIKSAWKAGLRHGHRPPIVAIVQTRLSVALIVFLLAHFTSAFKNSARISWVVLAYVVLTTALAVFPTALQQKRVRLALILSDMLAISFLVHATGGIGSSWFLLYCFPVLSASRHLGRAWTVIIATFSTLAYVCASDVSSAGDAPTIYAFWFRALMLVGVALSAANLGTTRDRSWAKLVSSLERIDLEILSSTDMPGVMHSILITAMDVTDSDLSALVLVNEGQTTMFHAAKTTGNDLASKQDQDELEACRLVGEHHCRVFKAQRPLNLPERRTRAATVSGPKRPARWPSVLVPLESGKTPLGVLGVFSRRALHYYTRDDVRKLSSMAPLVAMAQKNAKLFRELSLRETESNGRLQMLYEIGEQLRAEQGVDQILRNVVKLVSTRLRSEEAAVFVPDDRRMRLEKVAVSGPNDETTERLMEIEHSYESEPSLTRQVFESKKPRLVNCVSQAEYYVSDFSERLPSHSARHYLGVPLLIGEEVLGVIRVVNKKAPQYAPRNGEANLAEEGFEEDDVGLLSMIATQVASAIRNAKFIERNRYFEHLVYNSPDPIIVLDRGGKIQNFNRECEKIWGVKEKEVYRQPIEDYYESGEAARRVGGALWSANGHTIRDYTVRIRDAQGNLIPIRLSATLLLDKNGQRAGSIGMFRDERAMLHLEEQKMRAGKLAAIGRLAQTAGHDIKHDLGAILNYLDGLEDNVSEPDMREALSAIRDAANEALGKLQNMLMTAKRQLPEHRVISLKSILLEFESRIRNRTCAAQIDFSLNYPTCDPLVLADPDQLRQVLANLLGNSLDAIKLARLERAQPSTGRIHVTVEVEKDVLLLSWQDDGCGMSEKAKMNAFTAFFTTKDTGSGLGLFISKDIIENHGGHITVEFSERQGVCFRITLPRFQAANIADRAARISNS